MNGTRVWSKSYNFKASPWTRFFATSYHIWRHGKGTCFLLVSVKSQIAIFIFKCTQPSDIFFLQAEADGSNEFNNFLIELRIA
jgi:hypothetical protein